MVSVLTKWTYKYRHCDHTTVFDFESFPSSTTCTTPPVIEVSSDDWCIYVLPLDSCPSHGLGRETPALLQRLLTRSLSTGVFLELLGIKTAIELVASPTSDKDGCDCSPASEQDETTSETVERFLVSQEAVYVSSDQRDVAEPLVSESRSQVRGKPMTGAGDYQGRGRA